MKAARALACCNVTEYSINQDLELAYKSRPSYFVEPKGDWGPGRVELIELSTQDETNDNIVASWTPQRRQKP